VNDGEVAAIMGPNGSGKSTLSYVISGREGYDVTGGEILLNGENILEMNANPGIRSHLKPTNGQSRDIAGAILDYLFPGTAQGK
jgi:Fe-S cluster assembly ATPase SufC